MLNETGETLCETWGNIRGNDNNNNDNNRSRGLEISGRRPTRNSHVSWAGEVLFSLGWQSPRYSISIKALMVVQPKNTLSV